VCANDYARLGYPDIALSQARAALSHARKVYGRKSPYVALLALEVSDMLRRQGKHKQSVSTWSDSYDAVVLAATEARPALDYYTRLLEEGDKSNALAMEVEMLIGMLPPTPLNCLLFVCFFVLYDSPPCQFSYASPLSSNLYILFLSHNFARAYIHIYIYTYRYITTQFSWYT
jgi:hypothetical protein